MLDDERITTQRVAPKVERTSPQNRLLDDERVVIRCVALDQNRLLDDERRCIYAQLLALRAEHRALTTMRDLRIVTDQTRDLLYYQKDQSRGAQRIDQISGCASNSNQSANH